MNETDVFIPTGHPVRRFVVALAVTAVGLFGFWAVGLGAPRIEVTEGVSQHNTVTGEGVQTVELTNEGQFPVTVVEIRGDGPVVPRPLPDVRIGAGETVSLDIAFDVQCIEEGPTGIGLSFRVRGPLGVTDEKGIRTPIDILRPTQDCPIFGAPTPPPPILPAGG